MLLIESSSISNVWCHNQGFMQGNVQKGNFVKKPSQELKNQFCFRYLQVPLPSKYLDRQWVKVTTIIIRFFLLFSVAKADGNPDANKNHDNHGNDSSL